jgi:hypothetical protein
MTLDALIEALQKVRTEQFNGDGTGEVNVYRARTEDDFDIVSVETYAPNIVELCIR